MALLDRFMVCLVDKPFDENGTPQQTPTRVFRNVQLARPPGEQCRAVPDQRNVIRRFARQPRPSPARRRWGKYTARRSPGGAPAPARPRPPPLRSTRHHQTGQPRSPARSLALSMATRCGPRCPATSPRRARSLGNVAASRTRLSRASACSVRPLRKCFVSSRCIDAHRTVCRAKPVDRAGVQRQVREVGIESGAACPRHRRSQTLHFAPNDDALARSQTEIPARAFRLAESALDTFVDLWLDRRAFASDSAM